ncbi:hypothetical protein JTB14_031442 [Gonioctena quinquepunctata]|nr:hypothetical protein JTB14_031442 [Gonioctena quinquepunctata]
MIYNIPLNKIYDDVKGRRGKESTTFSRPTVFTADEEQSIAQSLMEMGKQGFGLAWKFYFRAILLKWHEKKRSYAASASTFITYSTTTRFMRNEVTEICLGSRIGEVANTPHWKKIAKKRVCQDAQ